MDLYKAWLIKILLLAIIAINLYLGLSGGFVARHYDTEYYKSKANKSYCLYVIYRSLSFLDYQLQKNFTNNELEDNLQSFIQARQRSSFALVAGSIFFSILGIVSTFLLANFLTANSLIALFASFFLATSFFWIQEMHYPTVDLPCAALATVFLLILIQTFQKQSQIGFTRIILLGILLGLAASMKFFALVLIIPLVYLSRNFRIYASIILIALLTLFVFLYSKLGAFSTRVGEELFTMFKTGFWGYDNAAGHTLWYHIETSLYQEYGLALILLALLGILFAPRYVSNLRSLKTIFVYMAINYLLVGLTMCNAPRYILPILPFFAIASAIGLYTAYDFLSQNIKLPKNLVVFICLSISILAVYQNFSLAFKHNALMLMPSTRDQVGLKLIASIRPYTSKIYDMPFHDDLIPSLPRNILDQPLQELALSCMAPSPIDFRAQYFQVKNSVVILSSNNHDSFIYSWHCQCKSPRKAFANFADLIMIVINPFTVPKDQVPFSPDSVFSPNPPDIYYRKQPGFYYEIFVNNEELAAVILAACKQDHIDCQRALGQDSYYLNRIQGVDYSTLGKRPSSSLKVP